MVRVRCFWSDSARGRAGRGNMPFRREGAGLRRRGAFHVTNIFPKKYLVIATLFVCWVVGYFDKTAINIAIIPIGKEFSISSEQKGMIISAFFMAYSLSQLIGGYLVGGHEPVGHGLQHTDAGLLARARRRG